jgi:hypothetical protein
MACNFQTVNTKIRLIKEYENVTQKIFIIYRFNTAEY